MKKAAAALAICLVIAGLLCVSPLRGRAVTETDAEVVFSISSENATLVIDPDDPLLQELCGRFNIGFDVVSTGAYDASEVYRLLASLNNLPDILLYDARWELNYFIQCGAIQPLPENMHAYPNLSALISYPYGRAVQYDGRLWGIPSSPYVSTAGMMDTCAVFYKDVYDAVWPEEEPPAAIDEWHDLLGRIRDYDPELIPLTSKKPQSMFDLTYFYSPATYTWIWNGSRYIPGYYADEFRESIAALKTLWDDGLLDPDFMNEGSGRPAGLDKFMFRQAAGILYNCSPYMWQSEFVPTWRMIHPDEPLSESLQPVFMPCGEDGDYYESYAYNMTSIYFGSGLNGGELDRALTLLDWLCCDEGRALRRFGFKDQDYTVSDDGALHPIADYSALYQKYPSYAFFRTLPDWDTMAIWQEETNNSDLEFLTRQYMDWRRRMDVKELPYTSIRANTVSTPAVLNFHPDILRSGYRLLTSSNIEAEFEKIKQEYRDDGILLMIDSVYYYMR